MGEPRCVPASLKHARQLAETLSSADRQELDATTRLSHAQALDQAVRASVAPVAYLAANRKPFAIKGVLPDGRIWMLSSDAMQDAPNRWFFARRAKADLERDQARWPRLFNIVDARNTRHMRLLQWLGFQFDAPFKTGVTTFYPFWRQAHVRRSI